MIKVNRILKNVDGRLVFSDEVIEQKSETCGELQYINVDNLGEIRRIKIFFQRRNSVTITDVRKYNLANLSYGEYKFNKN